MKTTDSYYDIFFEHVPETNPDGDNAKFSGASEAAELLSLTSTDEQPEAETADESAAPEAEVNAQEVEQNIFSRIKSKLQEARDNTRKALINGGIALGSTVTSGVVIGRALEEWDQANAGQLNAMRLVAGAALVALAAYEANQGGKAHDAATASRAEATQLLDQGEAGGVR